MSLLLLLAAALSEPAPGLHPNTALSCQLQVFGESQQRIDLNGDFVPFIIRFDEPVASTGPLRIEEFATYDPQNLLNGARPVALFFKPNAVSMTTSVDGPDGILDFTATDFENIGADASSSSRKPSNWVASLSLIGGKSRYRAIGPCYYTRGAAYATDEELVIRRAD